MAGSLPLPTPSHEPQPIDPTTPSLGKAAVGLPGGTTVGSVLGANQVANGVTGPAPAIFIVTLVGFVLVANAAPSLQPYAIGILIVIIVGMIYQSMNSGNPIQLTFGGTTF